MKILNLYCGIGGNRKLWDSRHEIVAVDSNQEIADLYQSLYPSDLTICDDAHQYLLDHAEKFDFIWSSPPCQSHSKMIRSGRNRKPRYADMRLYEEILFLQADYDGHWVVENVVPWYRPLVTPSYKLGRHLFWASSYIGYLSGVLSPPGFIKLQNAQGKKDLMDWLGIHFEQNIYYDGNHDPTQILRNCVHPEIGLQVFNEVILGHET